MKSNNECFKDYTVNMYSFAQLFLEAVNLNQEEANKLGFTDLIYPTQSIFNRYLLYQDPMRSKFNALLNLFDGKFNEIRKFIDENVKSEEVLSDGELEEI